MLHSSGDLQELKRPRNIIESGFKTDKLLCFSIFTEILSFLFFTIY